MSKFEVPVLPITVTTHPNADRLEIGNVLGYQVVVGKDQFKTGDLVAYIPEDSLVPSALLAEMGLEGFLDGPLKNRVRPKKLRGVLSQGLVYKNTLADFAREEDNIAEVLGITKYEPPLKFSGSTNHAGVMGGDFLSVKGSQLFRSYTDVENKKKYPNVLIPGELVYATEKLHGTCGIFGVINGVEIASSKGVAQKYHASIAETENNVYWKAARQAGVFDLARNVCKLYGVDEALVFGEVIGVQDLNYGVPNGEVDFYAFDILVNDSFVPPVGLHYICNANGVKQVPILYEGPYNEELLTFLSQGLSTLASHIREGLVVRPVPERFDPKLGRVLLKMINPAYLLRKNGTEYN